MPQIELPLSPKKVSLEFELFGHRRAENLFIERGIRPLVRDLVADLLLSNRLTACQAKETVAAMVRDNADQVIISTLRGLFNDDDDLYQSEIAVLQSLVPGFDLGSRDRWSELTLPREFVNKVAETVSDKATIFHHFEELHLHPKIGGAIFTLLRQIHEITSRFDTGGVDEAFALLYRSVGDKRYTVNHLEAEKLYFISYLPFRLRYALQDFVIGNLALGFLERNERSLEASVYAALVQYCRTGVFVNSHWDWLSKRYGASEKTTLAIATLQASRIEALNTLYENIDNPRVRAAARWFLRFQRRYYRQITNLHNKVGQYFFQDIDIGHCFSQSSSDLWGLIHKGELAPKFVVPIKNGGKALILEDEPQQMARYSQLIEKHSPYSVGPCVSDPREVLPHAGDKEIKCFLLDLQNKDDVRAGFRVASMLLDFYIRECQEKGLSSLDEPLVNITLWTASGELFTQLYTEVSAFIKQLPRTERELLYVHHSGGRASAPIRFGIHLKSEWPFR